MEDYNCPNCSIEVSKIEFECSNCGFPLDGTEKEKAVFIGKQISNKSKINDAKKSQKRVRNILIIIGGFQVLTGLFRINRLDNVEVVMLLILGVMFIVLGLLAPKKPLLFISIALGIILSDYIAILIIEPNNFMKGILWKIIILGSLIYGLKSSYEEYLLKKKHNFLK